jgi:hypothetical protein
MKEKAVIVVMQPRDLLWRALCERTIDLARYLEDIESAELVSKETAPNGLIRQVHFWRARANVPALLAPHINGQFLEWTGRVEWQADAYESRWLVEPRFMKSATLCEAIMNLSPAVGGKGTRLSLELEVTGAPGFAGVQTIAKSILTGHFRKLVDAASRLIESERNAV